MKPASIMTLLTILVLVAGLSPVRARGGRSSSGGGGNTTTAAFNPTSYIARPTALGTSSTGAQISLLNLGSASLTINALTLGGVNANDFSLSGTCANGTVVPRNSLCTLQAVFAPTATGTRTASLSATFANATALTLPMSGTGLVAAPVLSVSPAAGPIDFGTGTVGTPPSALFAFATIMVSNAGASTLIINSIGFSGANPGDFVFGRANNGFSNCFPGIPLSPLGRCYIGLNFAPTDVGSRSANLNLSTNDPANPTATFTLTGIGLAAPPPPPPPPIQSAFNFTDLWGNANEPGWSLSISHHKSTTDVLVAFWQTYDVDGRDMWVKLTDGHWVDSLTYTGNLHRATGPAFSVPYDANLFIDSVVGTAVITFTDANNGTFSYSINGVSGSKTISRVVF